MALRLEIVKLRIRKCAAEFARDNICVRAQEKNEREPLHREINIGKKLS
jgi:hypothetical protein